MTAPTAYKLAKKYGIKTAWGSDVLCSAANAAAHGTQLSKMLRWFTPAEALRQATADNAELLALSSPRNPYPGRLGVAGEAWMAIRWPTSTWWTTRPRISSPS